MSNPGSGAMGRVVFGAGFSTVGCQLATFGVAVAVAVAVGVVAASLAAAVGVEGGVVSTIDDAVAVVSGLAVPGSPAEHADIRELESPRAVR